MKGTRMRKCIYCLEDGEASAFSTEHVLPKALGTFRGNLTLPDCVCTDCNNYFGWNLDLFLTRDSIEALRRLQFGLKPLEEIRDLPLERLSFSVAQEGEWKGVRLQLKVEDGELVVEPMPQVALAKKGRPGWVYLTEQELADEGQDIAKDVDAKAGIRIFFPSDDVGDRLIALLAARGITFEKKTELPPPPSEGGRVLQEITYRIDPIIRRAVAKIAFNYMAYVTGSDFTYRPDFSVIRAFIRQGEAPDYPLVRETHEPILSSELPRWRGTKDHLITLNWDPSGRHIIGQVSLFNEITYNILLARNFSGLWRDIQRGHRFDISEHRVKHLLYSKLALRAKIRSHHP